MGVIFKVYVRGWVVLIISILSKSKAFYIAGLVPLFPTFALIAHVIVFQQKEPKHYKNGSVWSMVTYSYAIYLVAVYVLATRMSMWSCLD